MLRLDLLKGLEPSPASRAPAPTGGPSTRAALLLAGLLLAGGAAVYVFHPQGPGADGIFEMLTGKNAWREAARADSLRQAERLRAAASRQVDEGQALAIAWLRLLETLPPDGTDRTTSLAAYTVPDRFILRGIAGSGEAMSAVQEALALLSGIELRESRAEEVPEGPRGTFLFTFSGTVNPAAPLPGEIVEDSAAPPPSNRVTTTGALAAELDSLRAEGARRGVAFSAPSPVRTVAAGGMRVHTTRLQGVLDSTDIAGIRTLLENERYRGSPLGLRRVSLENSNGRKSLILDIMAFTP